MNWQGIKNKFRLFDHTGLSADTILNMRLLAIAVMGGIVWANTTSGIAFTGYWKELGASDTLYGLLLAMPMLANAFQFVGSYIMERRLKRTKQFVITGLIQRASWIPFALVPFVVPVSAPTLRIWLSAILVMASAAMNPFMNVAFSSICDDVIPIRIRGQYFASRSRISTAVGLGMGLVIGAILDAMPGMRGYCAAFLIAGVMGVLDICCFLLMKLPEIKPSPRKKPMFSMMKDVLADRHYMQIIITCMVWMFFVQMGGPYYNVQMRVGMGMSNLQITLISQICANLALILLVTRWGRAIDRYGSRPVLIVGSLLNALFPVIWSVIGKGDYVLLVINNFLAGGTWCAYELSSQNLYMIQARPENKSMYFALFGMSVQLAGSLGSFSGGWFLDNVLYRIDDLGICVLGTQITRYNVLFLIVGVMRISFMLLLAPRIREEGSASVGEFLKSLVPGRKRLAGR